MIDSGSLFSIFLLGRIMDIACCMKIVFISLKVCYISFLVTSNFFPKIFIDGMCVVALALAMVTINGCTFQPLLVFIFKTYVEGLWLIFRYSCG